MLRFKVCGLLLSLASTGAVAQSIGTMPFNPVDGNFSTRDVLEGVTATKAQCDQATNAVWVTVDSGSECIRYYSSSKYDPVNAKNVIIYFSGDLPVEVLNNTAYFNNYSASTNLESLKVLMDNMSSRIGIPVIQIARPGIMGSSGYHNSQRRRKEESLIMNQALEQIKSKLQFQNSVLVGHSGGGHVAASIGTLRNDIKCNILVSAVSMPSARAQAGGYYIENIFEPKDFLIPRSKTRYFLIGDRRDRVVDWAGQGQYARELRKKGIVAENIVLKSSVTGDYHNLLEAGVYAGSLCASDVPTANIVKQLHTRYAF